MKRKDEIPSASDVDERLALEDLKLRLQQLNEPRATVPHGYWANVLVRTNQRIDEVTSVRAISMSWAARVAIPGVVAILFFFIGLHYYVPDIPRQEYSVTALVNMLPQEAVDSVLTGSGQLGTSLLANDVSSDIFQFSTDQISDYLLATGSAKTAVENLSDSDMTTLMSGLDTRVHQ